MPCRLPAVAVHTDAHADAGRANADAAAWAVVPVAIGATLVIAVIAVARHGGIGVAYDHAGAATGAIAIAGVIADEPDFLNEIRAGVFTGRIEVGGFRAARRSEGADAGQQCNRECSHHVLLETALGGNKKGRR